MPNVLQSRRDSSRFQILVEIAAHQPNVRQKEVADKLGVTPQAVSEYIKELVADGLVETDGRMRYRITKRGVEWLLESAAELKRYARVVMEEIINHVSVWPAIARDDISEGERVTLVMEDGLLYATHHRQDIEASGIAISDASRGEDVGVSDLKGLISLEEGRIKICKVPRVQLGGSRRVDLKTLAGLIPEKGLVGALGIEALISLRKVGREPDVFFGSKEAVVEAAYHGVSSVIVSVDEQIPGILNRLESEGIKYELVDLTLTG